MKKLLFICLLIFAIVGCDKNIRSQPKRALVNSINTNLRTGAIVDLGWQEVIIIEEKGNMAKVRWIAPGNQDTQWIVTDNISTFKRLD